jgi:hypothetical protein
MLGIAPFAHELGLDTLGLSGLRYSPYSGLDELVAKNPGYHIAPDGKVYSDHCPVAALRRLRRRIWSQFYTPLQIARIVGKGMQNEALTFLPDILPRLPRLAAASIVRVWRRSRRRARKRRARRA